jgi:HAD superfamily hydrolase (TIGR01509 family)
VIRALLWDVDGTLAETERDGHLVAFNRAFEALGMPWRWSEQHYGELLAVAGGRERLLYDMSRREQAPGDARQREALAETVHRLKNQIYAGIVRHGELPLRAGVAELLAECCRAHLPMGIVTTTSRGNVEALLEWHLGSDWEGHFATIVSAKEAPRKKPDPQVYRLALEALRLRSHEAVAIEDAPAGIEAAQRAGVSVIFTPSHYFPACTAVGALAFDPSLGRREGWQPRADPRATRITLDQIIRWYTGATKSAPRRSKRQSPGNRAARRA